MSHLRLRTLPLPARLAALLVPLAAASFVATTAYTRDGARSVHYVCGNGERFSVEYLAGHVRLRTGAGIFALAGEPAGAATHYTDGRTAFRMRGDEALLERPGLATPAGCKAAPAIL